MPDWMTTPDIFLIGAMAMIAIMLALGPLLDARHEARSKQPGAKVAMYREGILMLWLMAAIAVLGWTLSGRTLVDIGFVSVRDGWQGLTALALAGLACAYCGWQLIQMMMSSKARASVRRQLAPVKLDMIRPTNRAEAWHFQAISFSAGVTEEVIFRGVLIAGLALVLPLWAAAALSVIAFTLPHAYQGPAGMAKVLPTGVFLTAIVLLGGSLWPAIIAHWIIDMTAGLTFAILDRHDDADKEGDEPSRASFDRDTGALEA